MDRRTLLQLPVALAAQTAPAATGFKLSVRVEGMFRGMTLPQQMEKVAEAGYQGFEFGDWQTQDATAITALKNKLGIECACIVGNRTLGMKGLSITNPADRDGFLAEMKASAEAAVRFETKRIVTIAGNEVLNMTRQAQHASMVEGLKRAHDIMAPHELVMILEPLNTLVNHKGYFLNFTSEAFDIVREVGSPYLKILFDIYHVQIMEGNLIATIRKNIASIGHFHVGDVPGRHEPGTGEIHYANVFKAIRELGYKDFVAMEYSPAKDPMTTLAEVKAMAS